MANLFSLLLLLTLGIQLAPCGGDEVDNCAICRYITFSRLLATCIVHPCGLPPQPYRRRHPSSDHLLRLEWHQVIDTACALGLVAPSWSSLLVPLSSEAGWPEPMAVGSHGTDTGILRWSPASVPTDSVHAAFPSGSVD
ncbi:uncharacterized protein LOC112562057 [Pomacea canaliculata]|uniref:uncharacterized protein LOC112562057 n=1 Tax=Pomacea canaliculata TaxID=400727 RepID=UPI000D73D560|nr:uncharacterized protein LOC112562057 [Pomacea canaliculata]